MSNPERDMLAYVHLAALARQKGQLPGRDKFLVLAASAACHAGWPDVARRCRSLILEHNPAHLIGRFESVAAALRSEEFQPLVKQLDRFCGSERAEFLLEELGIDPEQAGRSPNAPVGSDALRLLAPDN